MQTLAVASDLPARPLVLGGCCCSHLGAVEGLAARHGHVAVLWLDAHGDLNTPETSPSGNEWGMPLRMLLDRGTLAAADVVLWRARNLDPPEEEFIAAAGIEDDPDALLARADAIYVALDCDVFDPDEVADAWPDVPILGFTNHTDTEGLRRAHAAGFDQVVAKSALDERAKDIVEELTA